MSSPLVAFLGSYGLDHAGRRHEDVVAFDDAALEARHDFIQWLFPLPEPSRAVPDAPVMTEEDLAALRASPLARERLQTAAERMLEFYRANGHWLRPADHNHLRITRIIRSLRLILGDEEADRFRSEVARLSDGAPIAASARDYWARA